VFDRIPTEANDQLVSESERPLSTEPEGHRRSSRTRKAVDRYGAIPYV